MHHCGTHPDDNPPVYATEVPTRVIRSSPHLPRYNIMRWHRSGWCGCLLRHTVGNVNGVHTVHVGAEARHTGGDPLRGILVRRRIVGGQARPDAGSAVTARPIGRAFALGLGAALTAFVATVGLRRFAVLLVGFGILPVGGLGRLDLEARAYRSRHPPACNLRGGSRLPCDRTHHN